MSQTNLIEQSLMQKNFMTKLFGYNLKIYFYTK